MADTEVQDMVELTTQAASDVLYIIDDPAGTPLSRKITITNLFQGIPCDVGIGAATPGAKLHVDQSSTSGAIPVLTLDQADIDLEFIKLIGSSQDGQADRSLCDVADLDSAGALVGWFQIYVEDIQATNPITDGVYYVPFYAAPSAS